MSAIALAHMGGSIGQDDMTGHFFSIPVDSSDDATSGDLGSEQEEYQRTQNLHSFFNNKPLTVEIPVNNLFFDNQSCSPTDAPNLGGGSAFIPSQPQHLANLDPSVPFKAHGDSFSNQSQMPQKTQHNRSPSFNFDNKRSPIGTPAKVSPAPSEGCGEDLFDALGSRASWPGMSGFHASPHIPPLGESMSDHVLPLSPFDGSRQHVGTSKSSPSGSEDWWDASSLSVGSSPARLGYSLSQSQQNILQRAGGSQREWDSFGMQQQLAEQVPRRNQEPMFSPEMSLSSFALGGGIFEGNDNQPERRGNMRVPMMSPMTDQFNEEEMFGRMELNDSVPPSPPPPPPPQPLLSRSLTLSFSQQPDEQLLVQAVNSFGACRVLAPAGKCTYTVSYFDLRSASNCVQRLQNIKLGEARVVARFLDDGNFMQGMLSVHNVASTVQNFELMQLFRNCGDVQDVLGSGSQRIVSFFDLRHVRAASTYHGAELHGQPMSLVLPGVANMPSPLPSPFRGASVPSPSSQPQDCLMGLSQHNDSNLMEPLRASRQLSFPFPSSPPGMQQQSQADIPSLLLLQQQQEFESQQHPYPGINTRVLQMQQQQLKQQIRRGLMQATGSDAAAAHGLLSMPPVSPQMQSVSGRGSQGGGGGTPQRTPNKRSDGGSAPKGNMFLLDLDKVRSGEDRRTTLMIRNIPNKYSQKMLLSTVDEKHKGTYDFLYLPIDFKNKCNVGYAFINFIYPASICSFHATFNHRKWDKFNSDKVCELAYARIQGKQALISHFQNSSLMTEDKKCRPLIFFSEGPNQGTYEPFPVGPNVRRRADGRPHDEEETAGARK
mmetsp:Transcript_5083/g.12818  ORF Transcript_5083/g.12818 Transcript_5083/m.12818 type:complete len:827 (-) Transcript_5083:1834-4314(-)